MSYLLNPHLSISAINSIGVSTFIFIPYRTNFEEILTFFWFKMNYLDLHFLNFDRIFDIIIVRDLRKTMDEAKNVLGALLKICNNRIATGFNRDGSCFSSGDDYEVKAICIQASKEFLDYSKKMGNDLTEPDFQYGFYGLKPNQFWCLSAEQFLQAHKDGSAPKVNLDATHERILEFIDLDILKSYALE